LNIIGIKHAERAVNVQYVGITGIISCFLSTLIKRKSNFLLNKEIQNGAVAKSYVTNGLLIYGEIFAHFLICQGSPSSYMTFPTAPL
jgi:hypothetical protein